MKIALYYPWLYLTSGAERSIAELTAASAHEWTIFTNRFDPASTFPELQDRNVVELERFSVERSIRATALNCWKLLWQKLPLDGFDALVVVCEGLGDLVLFRNSSLPTFCLCLTPLRVAFDPCYRERALSSRGALGRLLLRAGTGLFRVVDRLAWKRYSEVFCISREVARRVERGGLPAAREIQITYPGSGFKAKALDIRFDPFFLIAGRIMWTKNIQLGIRAFERFKEANEPFRHFRLVIAGIVDAKSKIYYDELSAMVADRDDVEFRIFPSDAELGELYRTCYTVLFTPFNEDWGIVPLESMFHGKPVIAVKYGGPAESVAHGQTGLLVEPEEEPFASAMELLAANPSLAEQMGRRGIQHSQTFSWETFINKIDSTIDRTMQELTSIPASETTTIQKFVTGPNK